MLCIVFGLSLLDRTNISAAYIAGLAKDLRLDIGARYNIALLIFFIRTHVHTHLEKYTLTHLVSLRIVRTAIQLYHPPTWSAAMAYISDHLMGRLCAGHGLYS
jgi:hypothetical protein